MESPVLKFLRDGSGPDLTILTYTKTIQPEDVAVHEKWDAIKQWYVKTESHPDARWVDQAVTTIINSAIYQERLCFCLSSRSIEALTRNDKNWEVSIGYSPKNYKALLGRLTKDLGILECIKEGKGQKASAYQIIDQGLASLIQGKSLEEQRAEVLDFATKKKDISLELLEETQRETQQGNAIGKQVIQSYSQIVSKSGSQAGTASTSELENEDNKVIKKYSFKAILAMQTWEEREFPSFDETIELAHFTMENCEEVELDLTKEFNVPYGIINSFDRELLRRVDGKPNKKKQMGSKMSQYDLYKALVGKFAESLDKYFYGLVAIDADFVEPVDITKNKKPKMDKATAESVVQSNTLQILTAAFDEDKVAKIQGKLKMDITDSLRKQLEIELAYYKQKEL